MPTEDHPVNQPISLQSLDSLIKEVYGPAIEEQLNRDLPLLNMIASESRPVITRRTRWFFFKIELQQRLNDIYMHARYGYCDAERAYDNHEC